MLVRKEHWNSQVKLTRGGGIPTGSRGKVRLIVEKRIEVFPDLRDRISKGLEAGVALTCVGDNEIVSLLEKSMPWRTSAGE